MSYLKKLLGLKNSIDQNEQTFKNEIDLFFEKQKLASGDIIFSLNDSWPRFNVTIYNASPFTYQSGEFQIGIISELYDRCHVKGAITTLLPDGHFLHMLPFFDLLFPSAYTSVVPYLSSTTSNYQEIKNSILIFRVFTNSGYRDHILKIERNL